MPSRIHHLTHPGALTASAVVCGAPAAAGGEEQAQQNVTLLFDRSEGTPAPVHDPA